jgi:hypothetical protein
MRIANEIRSYGAQGRSEMDLRKICARRAHSSRVCAAPFRFPWFLLTFFQWHVPCNGSKPQLVGRIMETARQSIRREPKTTYEAAEGDSWQ